MDQDSIFYCEFLPEYGFQCDRPRTKVDKDGVSYCTTHYKTRLAPIQHEKEPWDKLKVLVPNEANGFRVLQKIRAKLKEGPNRNDANGSIYMYNLMHERHLNYWYITQHEMEESEDYIIIECRRYETKYVDFAEDVIHLYLSYCRVHRYPFKNGYHSVWALDSYQVINDGQEDTLKTRRFSPYNKQIDWFKCVKGELVEILEMVCNVICKKVKPRNF